MTPPSPFFSFYPQTLVISNEALSSRQSEATRRVVEGMPEKISKKHIEISPMRSI